MKIYSDVNPMNKVLHCANLEKIRLQMQNGIDEFKEKAPHRTDFIEKTEQGKVELLEVELFICAVYRELENQRSLAISERLTALKLAAENMLLKDELDALEVKYKGLIEFDKK